MPRRLAAYIERYYHKTKAYSNFRFIAELLSLTFLVKFMFAVIFITLLIITGLYYEPANTAEKELLDAGLTGAVFLIILYAAVETLLGQWLMLWVASYFTRKKAVKIFFSAIFFALLHIDPVLILTIFPVGIFLAWSFLIKWEKSLWQALWMTTTIHILHNLAIYLFISSAG